MDIERKRGLTVDAFLRDHLAQSAPVVVADAMDAWEARRRWTPGYLREKLGSFEVQIYDDLFQLLDVGPLEDYLDRYFGGRAPAGDLRIPYVRWYAELRKYDEFPWADKAFEVLAPDWAMPAFLPTSAYLLPYCPPDGAISATDRPFPAKGFFISAKGCRTRLHSDPWASDAVLFQAHGRKRFVMYSPDQAELLVHGGEVVDIDRPDPAAFPAFARARATFETVLEPGEAIFIPAGWFHHVATLEDSISLTWNFVHMTTWKRFFKYLTGAPPPAEIETIAFFLRPGPT
jgi:hypothetical protein